jgi:Putative abortive phage resistance protein AbiGi, antitoxin
MKVLSYSKNYEGKLVTETRKESNYRFSDEREWRFIPNGANLEQVGATEYVNANKYQRNKDLYNDKIKSIRLKVLAKDITIPSPNQADELEKLCR